MTASWDDWITVSSSITPSGPRTSVCGLLTLSLSFSHCLLYVLSLVSTPKCVTLSLSLSYLCLLACALINI